VRREIVVREGAIFAPPLRRYRFGVGVGVGDGGVAGSRLCLFERRRERRRKDARVRARFGGTGVRRQSGAILAAEKEEPENVMASERRQSSVSCQME
jgi:hypothetical protein